MFVKNCRSTVTMPDGGQITIRKLSHKSLDNARDQRQARHAAMSKNYGGEIVRALNDAADDARKAAEKLKEESKKDPVAARKKEFESYDRAFVLLAGVVHWTYPEAVNDETLNGVDGLDAESADTLFEAILDLSLPPVKAEAEAEMGKGTEGSMTT